MHDAIVEKLTENPRAFTAIATPWFSFTYGAINAFNDLEVRVPEDIALVGGSSMKIRHCRMSPTLRSLGRK